MCKVLLDVVLSLCFTGSGEGRGWIDMLESGSFSRAKLACMPWRSERVREREV